MLRWHVAGQEALAVPPFAGVGRADSLWEATCFELFVANGDGAGYREYNFSPSQRWAAYGFAGYREGRTDLDFGDGPQISHAAGDELFVMTVTMPDSVLKGCRKAGLNAVIVEKCGRKSFWALAHPPGEQPDFHDPACFAMPLDAPGAP